jgi:hypothetical protein
MFYGDARLRDYEVGDTRYASKELVAGLHDAD